MDYKTEAEPKAYADGVPVFCAHDKIVDVATLVPNPKPFTMTSTNRTAYRKHRRQRPSYLRKATSGSSAATALSAETPRTNRIGSCCLTEPTRRSCSPIHPTAPAAFRSPAE